MRVALLQHDIAWEDPASNFADLAPRVAVAAAAGARLVVLTEMFSTGFSMAAERIAEPHNGPSAQFLRRQATAHGVWVCGSVPERSAADVTRGGVGERPGNVLILASPSGELHRYTKIHPFSFAGEDQHYRAGTDFLTIDIEGVRTSFFVCYDLRFADEFWARAGLTDLYVVVANWPAARRLHWQTLLHARAIENQAYVVGCNRVGEGDGQAYVGDTRVIDPLGEILAAASSQPTMLLADIDALMVKDVRTRFPFLVDRRSGRP